MRCGMNQKCESCGCRHIQHGYWKLKTTTFYYDQASGEGCFYVEANCSVCGRKYPDKHSLYSRYTHGSVNVYQGDWSNDEAAYILNNENTEKEKTIEEFKKTNFEFSKFCPDCGSRMDGEPR